MLLEQTLASSLPAAFQQLKGSHKQTDFATVLCTFCFTQCTSNNICSRTVIWLRQISDNVEVKMPGDAPWCSIILRMVLMLFPFSESWAGCCPCKPAPTQKHVENCRKQYNLVEFHGKTPQNMGLGNSVQACGWPVQAHQ